MSKLGTLIVVWEVFGDSGDDYAGTRVKRGQGAEVFHHVRERWVSSPKRVSMRTEKFYEDPRGYPTMPYKIEYTFIYSGV